MRLVCLDLEGVLVPEIWIAFAEAVGIPALRRTTRDEPDYDKLMKFRLEILKENKLKLSDIQNVISRIDPLYGAEDFVQSIRDRTQLIILSDTFEQFAKPLMAKLAYPTLFCNTLITDDDGNIEGYSLRQPNGKQCAVKAFKELNIEVFAAGDSFNDLNMIREAKAGSLFRAPDNIREMCSDIPCVDNYDMLLDQIDRFLLG